MDGFWHYFVVVYAEKLTSPHSERDSGISIAGMDVSLLCVSAFLVVI
jgi:hypothetical protein